MNAQVSELLQHANAAQMSMADCHSMTAGNCLKLVCLQHPGNYAALMTCLDHQSEMLTIAACPGQPYSAFLYFLTKSKKAPPLVEFGFYFLLVRRWPPNSLL